MRLLTWSERLRVYQEYADGRISLEVLAEVLAEQSREQRRAWAEQRRRRLTPGKK